MAMLMEAQQVGQRQHLADLISNLDASNTTITSMIRKEGKPKRKLLEYQAEVYDDTGHEGVLDGKDVSAFDSQQREELQARSQKVWHNPAVSDFAEETTVAGAPGGEMARQKTIALFQVKRKQERRAGSDSDSRPDNGTKPNETRGYAKWVGKAGSGDLPVPEAVRTPADSIYTGTVEAFTEDELAAIQESQYNVRKNKADLDFVMGTKLKRRVTRYSMYQDEVNDTVAVSMFNQDAKSKVMIRVIDRLVTDFGTLRLHLSSYLYTDPKTGAHTAKSTRSGLILDMKMLAMAYTRMPRLKDLEDRGGGPRAICDAIFALLCYAPHGQAKVECES